MVKKKGGELSLYQFFCTLASLIAMLTVEYITKADRPQNLSGVIHIDTEKKTMLPNQKGMLTFFLFLPAFKALCQ